MTIVGWEGFSKYIQFEVGVGDIVKFWTDQWCGDLPLQLSFPVVYGIATNREAFVASSLERLGIKARRSWSVRFFRGPNDWELGEMEDLLCTLGSNLSRDGSRRRMGILTSACSIISFEVHCLLSFLG